MFLYERLEKIVGEVETIEEKFIATEEESIEEEKIARKLNDIEFYINKIEEILK